MKKKVLIIGYGSIGRRHAEVLKSIDTEVAFVRSGKSNIAKKWVRKETDKS